MLTLLIKVTPTNTGHYLTVADALQLSLSLIFQSPNIFPPFREMA